MVSRVKDVSQGRQAPRGKTNVRSLLQEAALKLFGERGYEQTTAAEIAAQAGVTERTFFRHFPDKREVLFDGEAGMLAALATAIAEAPEDLGPMDVLLRTFRSFEPTIERNRPFNEPRQALIAVTPALRERQLLKSAAMSVAVAAALEKRGVEQKLAALTAQTGVAVFDHAGRAWFEDPSISLGAHMKRAFQALHGLSAPSRGRTAPKPRPRPAGTKRRK